MVFRFLFSTSQIIKRKKGEKMKNWFRIGLVLMIVLGAVFVSEPKNVQAQPPAEGSWNTGKEVQIDVSKYPELSWMNLFSTAIKISAPTKICHPFRGGQYHWVGQIMQLKDGKWKKVTTVNDWVPSKEGDFMSCAQAIEAGTYALFGYYNGPAEITSTNSTTSTCVYDMSGWNAYIVTTEGSDKGIEVDLSSGILGGLPASFEVTSVNGGYSSPMSETTTTFKGKDITYALFANALVYSGNWSITIKFTMGDCSKNFDLSFSD
jgi:hypothetical protein